MPTLQQILDRKEEIKHAAKQLGFSEDVRMRVYEDKKLSLVVEPVNQIAYGEASKRCGELEDWLTYRLKCYLEIETCLGNYDSAISLDKEGDIQALIYGDWDIKNVSFHESDIEDVRVLKQRIPIIEKKIYPNGYLNDHHFFANEKPFNSEKVDNIIKQLNSLSPKEYAYMLTVLADQKDGDKLTSPAPKT